MATATRIPTQSESALPDDLRRAKAQAVTWFKVLREMRFNPEADGATDTLSKLTEGFFKFYKGFELEDGHAGVRGDDPTLRGRRRSYFLECRVGEAHSGVASSAGKRRLVLKIDSLQIKRMYFTTEHYTAESWWQLVS